MAPLRLYHLALRDLHAAAGATLAVRGEWSLPAHYGDPAAEYEAIRRGAAVSDRSQRSRFLVTGTDASVVLGSVFAGHVEDLEEGRAMRAVSLDDDGRITDLALIARTGGIAYLLSGEPGQRDDTYARLLAAARADYDVRIDDRTETTVAILLVGPQAASVAAEHLAEALPARLQTMHSLAFEFHGFRTLVTRTADVGEDGFEFVVAPAVGQHIVETLRSAGVPLAGTEAHEIARVESCIPAFDPDLSTGLTPAEADLDVLLGIPGGSDERILAAVLMEGEPVAAGTPLVADGSVVGEVRSCVRSIALSATIALGLLPSRIAAPGAILLAAGAPATVVARPFYRRRGN